MDESSIFGYGKFVSKIFLHDMIQVRVLGNFVWGEREMRGFIWAIDGP